MIVLLLYTHELGRPIGGGDWAAPKISLFYKNKILSVTSASVNVLTKFYIHIHNTRQIMSCSISVLAVFFILQLGIHKRFGLEPIYQSVLAFQDATILHPHQLCTETLVISRHPSSQ